MSTWCAHLFTALPIYNNVDDSYQVIRRMGMQNSAGQQGDTILRPWNMVTETRLDGRGVFTSYKNYTRNYSQHIFQQHIFLSFTENV